MADQVFFYGTLRTGFNRRPQSGIESMLRYVGRGSIQATLFDLGIYNAPLGRAPRIPSGDYLEHLKAK